MANPNLLNLTSVVGESSARTLTTSVNDLVANTASSNKLYRINSILVSNVDGTNAATVSIQFVRVSSIRYIALNINVPAQSSLVLLSKDSPLYLMEDDKLRGNASASLDLSVFISYDVME